MTRLMGAASAWMPVRAKAARAVRVRWVFISGMAVGLIWGGIAGNFEGNSAGGGSGVEEKIISKGGGRDFNVGAWNRSRSKSLLSLKASHR